MVRKERKTTRFGDLGRLIDDEIDVSPIATLADKTKAEYYDFRIVKRIGTSIEIKDGKLKHSYSGGEIGCAVRVLYKGAWGFFSTNDVSRNGLTYALEQALRIAKAMANSVKERVELAEVKTQKGQKYLEMKMNFSDIDIETKYRMIKEIDANVRAIDGIVNFEITYNDVIKSTHFINSEGTEVFFEYPLTAIQGIVVAKHHADLMGYRKRIGATKGFEIYIEKDPMEEFISAAKTTLKVLNGVKAPSGHFPVIADNELTGVFVHEAVGHASESDLVVDGESILEGKIGKRIGSKHVNISDDPTMTGAFGYFPFDDEGVKALKKDIIVDGILRTYILNRETAAKLGMEPNGGARAESYNNRPIVRMSNTYMLPGDWKFEEMLEDIKFGIYAKGTRGGQVDTAKGTFQFNAQEAYLIENGKITKTLRDVSLSGETLKILKNIDAVGSDFKIGSPGYCGKGQIVPVGNGGPHIRIKEAIIGGG